MANSDITTGAQTVTASGAVTGTLNTSTMSGDFTIKVDVFGMTSGTARIVVEDTANSTPFSDASSVYVFDIQGPTGTAEGSAANGPAISYEVRKYQVPSTRFGAANNELRVNVQQLTGGGPSLTLHAYLVQ